MTPIQPGGRPGLMTVVILLSIAGLAIAALVLASPAEGTVSGVPPPIVGDWIVDQATIAVDEVITIRGNVYINTTLYLTNTTIIMDSKVDNGTRVLINATGHLHATGAKFTSSNTTIEYGFVVQGRMTARRSTFEELWDGLHVISSLVVNIDGCSILEPVGRALYLEDADATHVSDVRIQSDSFGGSYQNELTGDINYEHKYVTIPIGGAIHVKGGNPTIDNVDISINGSYTIYTTVHKSVYRTYSHVDVEVPMILIEAADFDSFSGVTMRDSSIGVKFEYLINSSYYGGYAYTYSGFMPSGVLVRNCGDVTLTGCEAWGLEHPLPTVSYSVTGYNTNVRIYTTFNGFTMFQSLVDEEFTTAGPHSMSLELVNMSYSDVQLLYAAFLPKYSGSLKPTFDMSVIVDNVTVVGGVSAIVLQVNPQISVDKTVRFTTTITNSTFTNLTGSAVTWSSFPGLGVDPNTRTFEMVERFTVSHCLFRWNNLASSGLFYHPYSSYREYNNRYDTLWTFKDNRWLDNRGDLLNINGHRYTTQGSERLVIEGNTFENNTDYYSDYLLYSQYCDQVSMESNIFLDNVYYYGIYLYLPGGDSNGKTPCSINVINNTMRRCMSRGTSTRSSVFYIYWGGDAVFAYNNISETASRFLTLYEYTRYSGYSKLAFQHNEVHDNTGTIVWFQNYYVDRQALSVEFSDNKAWDNESPLTDYYSGSSYLTYYDYDARVVYQNNTVWNSSGTVFRNYGDISVHNNTFSGCAGYVVDLQYLNLHPPELFDNRIRDCEDVYFIAAKVKGVLKMSLSIMDMNVDCSGNAFYFQNVDVTLERVNITGRASPAIIADEASVDAIDSIVPVGSALVMGEGSVHVWFLVEAWIKWGSTSNLSGGLAVPDALLVLHGAGGSYHSSQYTDSDGHLDRFRALQWSLDGPFLERWSPYMVTVAKAGLSSTIQVDLHRSYTGLNALRLVLVDPYPPFVQIVSPYPNVTISSDTLNVTGFATEVGSGVQYVNISIDDRPHVAVELDERGDFTHTFDELPEGPVVICAIVTDRATNVFETRVTIIVDRMPPLLTVNEPRDNLITNTATISVKGSCEPGATVAINDLRVDASSGELDVPITLSEGLNVLIIEAVDAVGNSVQVLLNVTLDRRPPGLLLLSPRDGLATSLDYVIVRGEVDEGSYVLVSVHSEDHDLENDTAYLAPDGSFAHKVRMEDGVNVITVRCVDEAGNKAEATRTVVLDTKPPEAAINVPPDGYVTMSKSIRVIGWAEEEGVLLYLDGRQIHNSGTFDKVIGLHEGDNAIELRAVDAVGNVATHTVTVTLDIEPPVIVMTSPAEARVLTGADTLDLVGTVLGGAVSLTVDDVPVTLSHGGGFETTVGLDRVGLVEVTLTAVDGVGNIAVHIITVDRSTEMPSLEVTFDPSGDTLKAQSGTVHVHGTVSGSVSEVLIGHTHGNVSSTETFPVEGNGEFHLVVDLVEGENIIFVRVQDIYGNVKEAPHHIVSFERTDASDADTSEPKVHPRDVGVIIVVLAATLFLTTFLVTRSYRSARP